MRQERDETLCMMEECLHLEVSHEDGIEGRREKLLHHLKKLEGVFVSVRDSLQRISNHEQTLAALVGDISRNESTIEELCSSYSMLKNADQKVRDLTVALSDKKTAYEAKCEEVRQLRSRLTKMENIRISSKMNELRTHLVDIDVNEQATRRRASETLITAFEESERMRVALEKEVTKYKSIVDVAQNNTDMQSQTSNPVFEELAKLESINRSLLHRLSDAFPMQLRSASRSEQQSSQTEEQTGRQYQSEPTDFSP